jgi:hypothetical protein
MKSETKIGLGISVGIVILIVAYMIGMPYYSVWEEGMSGRAKLAHANFSKEVQVAESRAKEESAAYLAHAEVIAARGLDSAVRIVGGGLNENPNYLRYLFIKELKETQNQVIYLPTEAGLPILEANRFKSPLQTQQP